ncbi:MAG: 3-dehydroquinate synthase [Clostridia bacterium]|nr:3-dehydroquinate synthase [Clostridia bacterium]
MHEIIHCGASGGYDIHVGEGLLPHAGAQIAAATHATRAAIVTDSNVAPLYAGGVRASLETAGLETSLFVFPAGERSKRHETLLEIYGFLAESGITRSDAVAALGGGVTGDMAGFAAATYLRGIDFVQLPTTLLAQIDASVGGKTGVDLPQGKNLVGAFWQPRLVICDTDALKTLPARVFTDGMAEAVKYGCILDAALFEQIESGSAPEGPGAMIRRCIELKCGVVARDEHEKGERALLNFGHTLGHAIERVFRYETFTHGEAVAVGMVLAARAGEKNGVTQPGTASRISALLDRLGLPVKRPAPMKELLESAATDKKRSGGDIGLVMLRQIGESFVLRLPVARLGSFFGADEGEE